MQVSEDSIFSLELLRLMGGSSDVAMLGLLSWSLILIIKSIKKRSLAEWQIANQSLSSKPRAFQSNIWTVQKILQKKTKYISALVKSIVIIVYY